MSTAKMAILGAAVLLSGCERQAEGPLRIALIGQTPRIVDATLAALRPEDAVLTAAAAQGLVRLDASGQIVPGLAVRWSVSDDGLSYIFRLGDHRWPDGSRVIARAVVRRLQAASAAGSRNPLATVLTGIEEIVATTDEVFEIRLSAPRPNLLQHLARPEFGIVRNSTGTGPFRIASTAPPLTLSMQVPAGETEITHTLTITPARAAMAVTMFGDRRVDLVLGGSWGDLPIVRAAGPPAAALRFDPAAGLFGLAVVDADGALASANTRRALSMAIDRDAIMAAFALPAAAARATLTQTGLSNLYAPAEPYWAAASLERRQAEARRLLSAARSSGQATPDEAPPVPGPLATVRVAMPDTPGHRLLFAHLARDWRAVGLTATRVAMTGDADLRLVDAVAPSPGASWYLERFTCARVRVCSADADAALAASRTTLDARERAAYFAQADRLLTDAVVFVPIAAPVRWSLVSRRVPGFRTNAWAAHDLAELVARD